jgi:ACS family hexuronate transporter-like MFS transporter
MLSGVGIMICGAVAALPVHVAVALGAISLAVFGFGLWAPNMMSLFADAFPPQYVGTVTGLSGMGSGAGGMVYTLAVGWMLDSLGFGPVFVSAALIPLLAGAVLYLLFEPPVGGRGA